MKEIKKYTKVVRYGKSETIDVLKQGDIISITEKIDGTNASFRIDNTNDLGTINFRLSTIEKTLADLKQLLITVPITQNQLKMLAENTESTTVEI